MFQIELEGYFRIVNRLVLDKHLPPLSFENMPFFWFEGLLEDYLEEIKQRKAEEESHKSKNGGSDAGFMSKIRSWTTPSSYKTPKIK